MMAMGFYDVATDQYWSNQQMERWKTEEHIRQQFAVLQAQQSYNKSFDVPVACLTNEHLLVLLCEE